MLQVTSVLFDTPEKNDVFFVKCQTTKSIGVIDPTNAKVVDYLKKNKLVPDLILITHAHKDHTDGIEAIVKEYKCPVVSPSLETAPDLLVHDGDYVSLGKEKFRVIGLPGHTQYSIAYWNADHAQLFTGDTLFNLGCGRPFYSVELLFQSLQKIKKLPIDTLFYGGHEYGLQNAKFALEYVKNDPDPILHLIKTFENGESNYPASLAFNLTYNPFLNTNDIETFKKRRIAKSQFPL